jgi:two-component system, chemotaxis family, chemotaxis protein CheY
MFDLNTRILIVDDMEVMRKLVVKSCKEIGFTDLTEAADGTEGWGAISSANPPFGLVISDWDMPNATGLDLLIRVRREGRFSKLPFIIVTTEAEESQIIEAAKAGVSQYLVKPFTTELLRERIESVHKKISGK